jgi:hypothetical protein
MGTWTLTATPLDGLPDYFDFVGVLKGSNGSTAYLFDEALFDGDGGGSWTIKVENNGGQFADLSNLTVYGRQGTTPPEEPGPNVPVPAPLALFGIGGLLMAWSIKRKRA